MSLHGSEERAGHKMAKQCFPTTKKIMLKFTHVRAEKPVILKVFVLQLNLQVYIAQDFGMQNHL